MTFFEFACIAAVFSLFLTGMINLEKRLSDLERRVGAASAKEQNEND